jgi:DsbC/DsbD-like thiol-disulfide interchange protein/cytochrome c biogenesis protein CcdA
MRYHFLMKPVLALLLALAAAPARAGMVDASLVSARAAASPGETVDAGLLLRMRDGWHVYWKNPGDAGLAPKLAWTLPAGWSAGPLSWPAPTRLIAGPLTSFGYEGEVLLPLRLTVPADAKPGTRARLTAQADWLECREACVPGRARLALNVPVSARADIDPAGADAIEKARAQVPAPDAAAAADALWDGTRVRLRLNGKSPLVEFFPLEVGVFENARSPAALAPDSTELLLTPEAGTGTPARVTGVIVAPGRPPVQIDLPVRTGAVFSRFLLLAFGGGLLLNLMPCVFPVLAVKALGLLARGGESPGAARRHAAAYAAGVVLSCEALAGVLLASRAAGTALGWGFPLQSPWTVAALTVLFAAAGLNLLGVFEVGGGLMGTGARLSSRSGIGGSFFSGVFAMVAAAPCTAPFMGAALGWALTRPAGEALATFGALGAGAAAPYALLTSWPALLKRLPRPGRWMEALKRFFALPMFATSAWLAWVLWRLVAAPVPAADGLWKPWSPDAVDAARAEGRTTFVDYTAAWCLSCQVNERVVLSVPAVRAALARPDVAAFRADWTARDPRIAAELARYGRDGVPLYVVRPRGGEPVLLPELLTERVVLDALGAPQPPGGNTQ